MLVIVQRVFRQVSNIVLMLVLSQSISEVQFVLFYNLTTSAAILSVIATFGIDAQLQKNLTDSTARLAHIGKFNNFKFRSSISISLVAFFICFYILHDVAFALIFSMLIIVQCFLTHFENLLYLLSRYSKDLFRYSLIIFVFFFIKLLIIYETMEIKLLLIFLILEMLTLIFFSLKLNKELAVLNSNSNDIKFFISDNITNTLIEFFAMIILRLPQYLTSAYGFYEFSKLIIIIQKPIEFLLVLTSQWYKQKFKNLKNLITIGADLNRIKLKIICLLSILAVTLNVVFNLIPTELILEEKHIMTFFVMSVIVITHSYLNLLRQINNMLGKYRVNLIGYMSYTCFAFCFCYIGIKTNSLELISSSLGCAGCLTLFPMELLMRRRSQ
jgi:hypothetical protein